MNPQRCSTCKNELCEYYKYSNIKYGVYDDTADKPLALTPSTFTGKMGCASHSDFNHAPTTVNAGNWTHEEIINRLQCAYDKGAREERERSFLIVRNVINTDTSGLASSLTKVRELANGYRWIPDNEWGSYDYSQRTVETLQKECGFLIDEIDRISYEGLRDSGNRIIEHIKSTEKSLYEEL